MPNINKKCRLCTKDFIIDDYDQNFYDTKMKVPHPTHCSDCRLQRRLSWRTERNLHIRSCDANGKQILSQFPPDSPYTIYFHDEWYGEIWDAKDHAQEYDFSRPFFDQFADLLKKVPLLATNVLNLQNCDYVNQCGYSKNCYFTIESDQNQDCMHTYRTFYNKTIVDCTETVESERCYECIDCEKCFNITYSQLCEQVSDSAFMFDCRSCTNCFGCVGLRQKRYYMFNQKLTKEQYEERMAGFDFSNRQHIAMGQQQLDQLKASHPRKCFTGEQNDNVTGNYIYQSKDCFDSFGIRNCRDCRYCQLVRDSKDCQDYFVFGSKAERIYESECCGEGINNLKYCCDCFNGVHDLMYCFQCMQTSTHCFGCVGLKKQQYCILNKQYSKEEYEELIPKIIDHMKMTGEWGEFFPSKYSPYAYNETVANEYFPLSKEEVTTRGLRWEDNLPFTTGQETITWDNVPENIDNVEENIINEVLACTETGKNFRITKQEILLYKQMHIPIPLFHPDIRHIKRMQKRNPRQLFDRQCSKCQSAIRTSYSPDKPEVVYCEQCYLDTVY